VHITCLILATCLGPIWSSAGQQYQILKKVLYAIVPKYINRSKFNIQTETCRRVTFVMMSNTMTEVRVTEDSCVIHLYFGVPEECSSMQSTKSRIFSPVEVSSCYPCMLQIPVDIHCIEADVSLKRQHYFYVSAGSRSTSHFWRDG
jgi:hypothetical protein